jgi:hypothetical protein
MTTKESENVVKELSQLQEHKLYNFVRLLGDEYSIDVLEGLIENQIDYHELENLLEKGCSKDLAIEILS